MAILDHWVQLSGDARQWEYQVGPCEGSERGDHLWLPRYLMIRVCEAQLVNVSFDPKPIPGDWNGAGYHTNSPNPNGYGGIIQAIETIGEKRREHIKVYGTGNERRLTGAGGTAPIDESAMEWRTVGHQCASRAPQRPTGVVTSRTVALPRTRIPTPPHR